jgi:hypothetical protein
VPITLNRDRAFAVLRRGIELARSDARLPVEWTAHARTIYKLDGMTWTPAFGTILLAKAVDERVDVFSLKANTTPPSPFSYSARGLCHDVLVPSAIEHGFSIRNTGREPLNNSPFLSASRIEEIERRAKNQEDFRFFRDVVERVSELTAREAWEALAAFLREAIAVAGAAKSVSVRAEGLDALGVDNAVRDFLRPDAQDRPRRLQAFAAACLDLSFPDVRSRRLNDPSRDFPGDVQVVMNGAVTLAMEVRGKSVSVSDFVTFARACDVAGVGRAVMFVDAPTSGVDAQSADLIQYLAIPNQMLRATQVSVMPAASQLLAAAMLWANTSLEAAITVFAARFLDRLREIEANLSSLEEWSRAVAVSRGS